MLVGRAVQRTFVHGARDPLKSGGAWVKGVAPPGLACLRGVSIASDDALGTGVGALGKEQQLNEEKPAKKTRRSNQAQFIVERENSRVQFFLKEGAGGEGRVGLSRCVLFVVFQTRVVSWGVSARRSLHKRNGRRGTTIENRPRDARASG